MTLRTPAKLNLFLHVVGRREDGYHELQTVFDFVDLFDEVSLQVRDDGEITRPRGAAGVAQDEDLVVRAARLLQRQTGCSLGAEISVRKSIPMGGGLGGGSSNAAAVLLGLNRLWGIGLDEVSLAEMGLELGADVPVFVRGRTCFAQGVGELINPVAIAEPRWYWLADPPCHIPTAEIFSSSLLTRDSSRLTIRDFLADRDSSFEPLDPVSLVNRHKNDCECAAKSAYEPLRALWQTCEAVLDEICGETEMSQTMGARKIGGTTMAVKDVGTHTRDPSESGQSKLGVSTLRMTGTGSSVFVAATDEQAIRVVQASCAERGVRGRVVRGMNRSTAAQSRH